MPYLVFAFHQAHFVICVSRMPFQFLEKKIRFITYIFERIWHKLHIKKPYNMQITRLYCAVKMYNIVTNIYAYLLTCNHDVTLAKPVVTMSLPDSIKSYKQNKFKILPSSEKYIAVCKVYSMLSITSRLYSELYSFLRF